MSSPLRIGVVGTGFGARVVAPTFAATEGCRVTEVVSARDDAAVHALCRRRDVDLVSVHSPPFLHAAHVRAALDAGHAVLCDKPMGRSADESAAMLADADAAGVVHLVNFEFRFDPARRRMREWIVSGAIGRPEHVQWTHLSAGSRVPLRPHGWLFRRELGGGWIGAWGSHAVDTLRFLLGAEVEHVEATPRTTIRERPDRDGVMRSCDAEDGLTATLRLSGDVGVAIDSGFAAPVSLPPRLVVVGSEGLIENVADVKVTLRALDGTRDEVRLDAAEGDRHNIAMARFAVALRDTVRDGDAPRDVATFADGFACDRVLDAMRRVE